MSKTKGDMQVKYKAFIIFSMVLSIILVLLCVRNIIVPNSVNSISWVYLEVLGLCHNR
jgi:predicted neutral ceramidase superfamily lipid hydrolase